MATTWASTSIPDPTTWSVSEDHIGGQTVTADGALNTDTLASKNKLRIEWENITTAQRDTIRTKYLLTTANTLSLPGGDSYSVRSVRGSYSAKPIGITPAWDVSLEVREA